MFKRLHLENNPLVEECRMSWKRPWKTTRQVRYLIRQHANKTNMEDYLITLRTANQHSLMKLLSMLHNNLPTEVSIIDTEGMPYRKNRPHKRRSHREAIEQPKQAAVIEAEEPEAETRTCANKHCGKQFIPKTKLSTCCSRHCQNIVYLEKKSQREDAEADETVFTVLPDGRKEVEVHNGKKIIIRPDMEPGYARAMYLFFHHANY